MLDCLRSSRVKFLFYLLLLSLFFLGNFAEAKKTIGDAQFALGEVVGPSGLAQTSDISTAAGDVVKWILSAVGLIFFILMVYAGVVWMTARGDEERVNKARNTIISAVIGLVITVSAYAITNLVIDRIISKSNGSAYEGEDGAVGEDGEGTSIHGCCILPADQFSLGSAFPSLGSQQECTDKAKEILGTPGYSNQMGSRWDYYSEANTTKTCTEIAKCWVAETGSKEEQCVEIAIQNGKAELAGEAKTNVGYCAVYGANGYSCVQKLESECAVVDLNFFTDEKSCDNSLEIE